MTLQHVAAWLLIGWFAARPGGASSVDSAARSETLFLSGTGFGDTVEWQFRIDRGRRANTWTRIPVPSQWELAGFGGYAYGLDDPERDDHAEVGRYRHEFEVPRDWQGRRVALVFEGVMTDATVTINGRSVGPTHRGGFTRFSYDVTDRLEFGAPNLLEVEVAEASSDSSVNAAEREADYWVFGGIYRPVYLEAVPARSIAHVAIDAREDGDLAVTLELVGAEGTEEVWAEVRDLASGRAQGPPLRQPLAGERHAVTLRGRLADVRSWSAERPHLYGLEVRLEEPGRVLHGVDRRIGFRTVEIRPGLGLFVNGRRTLLKGVNRHSFWPESGRALNSELDRRDAELIKELNANAVRTSHYPPDREFLDACDELGLYVIDELPGWHDAYRPGVGGRLVAEMVRRDVNHPSVILWANGNEGGWNSLLDHDFARHDPQDRAVIHPGSIAAGIEAVHYPVYDQLDSLLADDSPVRRILRLGRPRPLVLATEMLHGLYDGGGGAGLAAYWKLISESERALGGFLWSLFDEGVVRTDQAGAIDNRGNHAPDGITGPDRQREASFDAVRELWSPVQVEGADWAAGRVRVRNLHVETDLSELDFRWQGLTLPGPDSGFGAAAETVVFERASPGPELGPGARGELLMDGVPDLPCDAVRLTAIDPAGRALGTWAGWVADAATLRSRWLDDGRRPEPVPSAAPDWLQGPRSIAGGTLTAAWTALASGWVRLEVEHADPEGFALELPGLAIAATEWLGDGPWPVWSNRLAGSSLGLWRRDLDDPAAEWRGARGFFQGVRWIKLSGPAGLVTVVVEPEDLFVGVSTPRFPADARNARSDLPALGDLSFLWRLPAIGTKFHAAASLGPAEEPVTPSNRRDVLWLRFEAR